MLSRGFKRYKKCYALLLFIFAHKYFRIPEVRLPTDDHLPVRWRLQPPASVSSWWYCMSFDLVLSTNQLSQSCSTTPHTQIHMSVNNKINKALFTMIKTIVDIKVCWIWDPNYKRFSHSSVVVETFPRPQYLLKFWNCQVHKNSNYRGYGV